MFITKRNRIGERPFLYEINYLEAMDIDEEVDFSLAEEIYKIGIN